MKLQKLKRLAMAIKFSEPAECGDYEDQLDVSNSTAAECAVRHPQSGELEGGPTRLWHPKVKKKFVAKRCPRPLGRLPGTLPLHRTGGALVNPERAKSVAEKSSRDSQILREGVAISQKQSRKACEERALPRK